MDLFYDSVNTPVKGTAPRKSRHPFKSLSDEEATQIAIARTILLRGLDSVRPDKLLDQKRFLPFELVKPHLMHGVLAESIFRKQLKDEELVYEDLTLSERKKRRAQADVQAYVDLVRDGVFDSAKLAELGSNLPEPSPIVSRGRPTHDLEMMFRIVMLGCQHRLSDQGMFDWLCESAVVCRVVGITDVRRIPSPQAIWLYREAWVQHDSMRAVFDLSKKYIISQFPTEMKEKIGKMSGVDGTFVNARRRHVSSIVHQQILDGLDPVEIFDNPAERRQRDVDARHTKKNNESYFGYKTSAKVCLLSKLITDIFVSPANLHDSQALDKLYTVADKGSMVFADSAYNGRKQRDYIESIGAKPLFIKKISEINKLLKDPVKLLQDYGRFLLERNTMISRQRVRIEHVFAYIETCFGGSFVRSVSLARATAHELMTASCYNAVRACFLLKT